MTPLVADGFGQTPLQKVVESVLLLASFGLAVAAVRYTSAHLVPDRGHVHLFLDGNLLTMLYGTSTTTYAYPGAHRLSAEFVAVDHGPFEPPVRAAVAFRVVQ